jgi:hypothetical protein
LIRAVFEKPFEKVAARQPANLSEGDAGFQHRVRDLEALDKEILGR